MIALLYLADLIFFGDVVGRRLFRYTSWPHRLATAFLIGLVVGSWVSYLAALAFQNADQPLGPGDLLSASALAICALWLRRNVKVRTDLETVPGTPRWDWIALGAIAILVTWMMASTFSFADGQLRIASGLWSDFGPTTALSQSFAYGHNFPTQYPHFAGEPIRYHFLFYFQVGNLTHLGLDPALANNVLSILSMVAMLVLVMALGRRLFRSALVGRIGALLFFAHGTLSFVGYLASFKSVADAVAAIPHLSHLLASGFGYRGEDWGIWTQIVFLNQRHLASAIGILLIVLVFLADRIDPLPSVARPIDLPAASLVVATRTRTAELVQAIRKPAGLVRASLHDEALPGFVFSGALLGLLPLWNGAIFIAAAVVLGVILLLLPNRIQMLVLGATSLVFAAPQLLFLHPVATPGGPAYPSIFWGYVVDDPTPVHVATYLAFDFGLKLVLAGVALVLSSGLPRRLFAAVTALVILAFTVQVSTEVLANHKFLNTWLVVTNLFVAFALVRLWNARPTVAIPARVVAIVTAVAIALGGVIDLIPIANQQIIGVALTGDRLYDWVQTQTRPSDVFLSDIVVVHPILLAGRKVYYGWPYYAWSAGYDTIERERTYREMLETRSPRDVARLLEVNHIAYVAIDDGLRQRGYVLQLNEEVFSRWFQPVFVDTDHRYGNLVIYRVPATPGGLPDAPPGDMYVGGQGPGPGQFEGPQGAALESSGTLLVADTGNNRIERLSPSGTVLGGFGTNGPGPGQFDHPSDVAVDSRGNVYVTDPGNRRVDELDPNGVPIRQFSARELGIGMPRALAVGPDDAIYVLDQSTSRIAKVSPDGVITDWGSAGHGSGQMSAPTAIATSAGMVAVADVGNSRIDVFGVDGSYQRSWSVPEWASAGNGSPSIAIDASGRTFVSSPASNQIIVYQPDGTRLGLLKPNPPDSLDGPSGIVLRPGGSMFVVDQKGDRVTLLPQTSP